MITYASYARVREWDGGGYDRISAPMEALGRAVLDRLELRRRRDVLDAGCGSGRITEALIERLPRGRVIAVDASASMVARRARAAARSGCPERVEVREADLLELELEEPVDAILSTATFHWIADHERLFARLHAALRPGGRLVAQCGGEGNIDVLRGVANAVLAHEPYAEHFRDWRPPWNYAGPEATTRAPAARRLRLRRVLACSRRPQQPEHPREFLSTIVLGPHVQQLPEELREQFMDDGARRAGRAGRGRLHAPEHRRRRVSALAQASARGVGLRRRHAPRVGCSSAA